MAVELVLWLLVSGLGVGGVVFGLTSRKHFLFILGCAMLIGSGALLWGGNGLIVDSHPTEISDAGVITYTDTIVTMSDVGLQMLALALIACGILFVLAFDFVPAQNYRRNGTFHY